MRSIFLLVFLFGITEIFAQDFNKETMFNNKVEKVSVYSPVPKTNPEYYNEPIGFMHIADRYFNEAGEETNSICYNCSCGSHVGCKDLVKTFRYEYGKLAAMHVTGLDTINVSYLYYPIKSCRMEITTDDKDIRIGLMLVYTGLLGKETSTTEVSFQGVSPVNHYVYLTMKKMLFSDRTKKILTKMNLYTVTMEQVALLNSSKNLDAIEECIRQIEKQLSPSSADDPRDFEASYLNVYDANGNLIKNFYNPDDPGRNDKETYEYDENGLLKKSAHYYQVFTDRREYRYSYRK